MGCYCTFAVGAVASMPSVMVSLCVLAGRGDGIVASIAQTTDGDEGRVVLTWRLRQHDRCHDAATAVARRTTYALVSATEAKGAPLHHG